MTSEHRRARLAAGVLGLVLLGGCLTAAPAAAAPAAASAIDAAEQQAVDEGVAAAAADGVTQSVAVVDRETGEQVAGSDGTRQYISESITKLFTVAYYAVRHGGQPDTELTDTLQTMIIHSDDSIESSLWNTDIVPSMAARYGLDNTSNGPKTGPHDWGWELITADDEARFLFKMSRDPEVAPILLPAMAEVAPTGADGFDQDFGMNALTGDHGSKQGWTDVGSTDQIQIHSVGWTGRFFVAILQTSTESGYDDMRTDSTRTARLVQQAAVPSPTTSTPPSTTPAPATPTARAESPARAATLSRQIRASVIAGVAGMLDAMREWRR